MNPAEAFGVGLALGLLPLMGALLLVGLCWAGVYTAIAATTLYDWAKDRNTYKKEAK